MAPRPDAAWQPSPVRPLSRFDIYLAIAVFVVSAITAAFYLPAFRASGGHAEFYQEQFGPAVMSACGRGYVALTDAETPPSLHAFLDGRAGSFTCTDLPQTPAPAPLSSMQSAFKYLMLSASIVWRVHGVSWNAIDTVLSALFAVSLTGGYLALRSVAGRTLSVIGTLLWLGSPMHLGNLPHLRDYSKTPFFVITMIAMAAVVSERRLWRLLLIGASFGLAQGIGFGMRTDVILNFAPFMLVLFAAGARRLLEDVPAKLACAAMAIVVFTAVAWPILRAYGQAEGLAHVGILGLTTPFDEPLGIRRAPYDFGYLYNDSFAAAEVNGDWARTQLGTSSASPSSTPYAKASRAYYAKLATTFPGDFATRMAGAVIQTLNLPFSITYGRAPAGVSGIFARIGEWRTLLMLSLIGTGPLVVMLLLIIISTARLRDGVVACGLLLFWTAYPFIQFHGRHTFHLEFLVIAGFLGLFSLLQRTVRSAVEGLWPHWRDVARGAAVVIALIAVSVIVITLGRAFQTPGARMLLHSYEQATAEPLSSAANLFDPPRASPKIQQAMLGIEAACAQPADVTVRYQGRKDQDFTRPMRIPPRTRIFLPVYAMDLSNGDSSRFTGVEAPPCVRVSRIRGIDQLLWIDATLAPDWTTRPLYERVYIGPAFPQRIWLQIAHWWPSFANLG